MKIEKHHFYLFPILITVIFSLAFTFSAQFRTWAQTTLTDTTNTATTTTAPAPVTCAFSYSNWSECSSSGMQTRSITSKSPSGCSGGTPEPLSRACAYVRPATETTTATTTANTTYSCSYTYSEWGNCNSDGRQYRTVKSATPTGCSGTPETKRSCTYTAPATTNTAATAVACAFTYSDWSVCSSTGMQYRTITSKTPSGCGGGTPEPLSRSCTYVRPTAETTTVPVCAFSYSNWSECSSSGMQTRSITSKSPSGCSGGTPEPLSRACTYVRTAETTTTITATTANTALDCTPNCTVWSSCSADGIQLRTCSAPAGCPSGNWTEKNYCSISVPASQTLNVATNCIYQCSSWSDCLSGGYQERKCQKPTESSCLAYPERRACEYFGGTESAAQLTDQATCTAQCSEWSVCSPAGMKARKCWPTPSGCSGETKIETAICAPSVCRFTYSEWNACWNGVQFRTILSAAPADCVGGEPVLKQACTGTDKNVTPTDPVAPEIPASSVPVDPETVPTADWNKNVFQTETCQSEICRSAGDPDRDGLNNKDEFRFGTDPLRPDTDKDGKKDGEEVARGTDPLKSSAEGEADEVVYENPKEAGTVKEEIYQVHNVEMVSEEGEKSPKLKVSGKGPADSYLNVYIYSENPVIVTVKTDANGDWSYVVDQNLEDGDHEVYVAITSNTGAVKSKSQPLPFVKTAQAVNIPVPEQERVELPISELPRPGLSLRSLLFLLAAVSAGLMLAAILIGSVVRKAGENDQSQ